jgi:hypothetical protein
MFTFSSDGAISIKQFNSIVDAINAMAQYALISAENNFFPVLKIETL